LPQYLQPGHLSASPGAAHEQEADHVADAVMRKPISASPYLSAPRATPGAATSSVQAPLLSGGQPLDAAMRAHYEAATGEDLGAVRVHSGHAADKSALGMNANAYTIGSDIVFAASHFAPGSHEGRRLLAHELTHVVQQRGVGHAAIQLQSAEGKKPVEEARDLAQEMFSTPKNQRAPVVAKVQSKAAEFVAALQVAKSAKPPTDGPTADVLRDALRTLADTLIITDQARAAVQIAIDSKDAQVQTAIVALLLNRSSGVAGQQRLLSLLAPLAGEKIAAAGPGASSTQWLEANTPAIGRTFSKLEQMGITHFSGEPVAQALSSGLLNEYFTTADHDVAPDVTGKVSGLTADSSTRQIEADCDVFATYGARLLREQGWSTWSCCRMKWTRTTRASRARRTRWRWQRSPTRKARDSGIWAYPTKRSATSVFGPTIRTW
jgi:hypothetical protein